MRGRYNSEGKVEQHLEINNGEYVNTITTVQKDSLVRIGSINKGGQGDRIYDSEGVSATISSTTGGTGGAGGGVYSINERVRKLTPLETWRLMGFSDEDFYKAKGTGISNTALYKQAGNSIVVNVLEEIFKNLFF